MLLSRRAVTSRRTTYFVYTNLFLFVSLLFFPAFKGSAYKGIPPIWDEIFGPLNKIVSPIRDFSFVNKVFVSKILQLHKKRLKKENLNACLKVNNLKAVVNRGFQKF